MLSGKEKRVTMAKTWHDYGNPNLGGLLQKQKRVTIYLNRATILGAIISYLSWRLFWKQGWRFGESKVRFWDLKTARRAISSTFYQFMYVLIPLLIMLFVNSIMSS
jgi:heme O synthase-like polyprenyltransferase